MSKEIVSLLKDPPKQYRPVPFWSWNDRLSSGETAWQIEQMDQVGIGGYFMHARGGLQTEYLKEEWMDNIRTGLEEGSRRGMGAWGYDENGWPSGFGDGMVNGMGESYQQKYLRYAFTDSPDSSSERTIVLLPWKEGYLHFYYDVNPFYVDTLDPKVTQAFLQKVHERYKAELGGDFSKFAGFFTDEPQVSRNGIPWSLVLPQAYRERYGEELLPVLPALFFREGNWEAVRVRFWSLVRDLFADGFMKQIYDWCEKNGTRLTGHMVLEETMSYQLTCNGACMPCYEYFHIPGMDWLGRSLGRPLITAQLASVAQQTGKKQVLSETFACCGWDVSFEELKWMFEWQMVRGVTLLCQHLEAYSLRGIRKRDYPASHSYQQPWWEEYRAFNDMVSRLGMLLTEGESRPQLLVLHPQSSAWICFDNDRSSGLDELDEQLNQLLVHLEDHQIPYHLGDERIVLRHGRVESAPARFRVGEQAYSVVVVPPSLNLSSCNMELLEEFAAAGGQVIFCGQIPGYLEGVPSDRPSKLARQCRRAELGELAEILPQTVKPLELEDVSGSTAGIGAAVRYFPREQTPFTLCYLVNSQERPRELTLRMKGRRVEQMDAATGQLLEYPSCAEGEAVQLHIHLEAQGSAVLLVYSEGKDGAADVQEIERTCRHLNSLLSNRWEIVRRDFNALTLDYCDCYLDGKLWEKDCYILNVQEAACRLERPVEIRLDFRFQVKQRPEGELFLVLECPEKYDVLLNGQTVSNQPQGYYRDKALGMLPLDGRLREGENLLQLKTLFRQTPEVYENLKKSLLFESEKNKLSYLDEIEAVYLVGNFGLETSNGCFQQLERRAVRYNGGFALMPAPQTVSEGSLVEQGFPFFNGRMVLGQTVYLSQDRPEPLSLRFSRRCTNAVKVWVNGVLAGTVLWRPYEVELTPWLQPGENRLEIELIGNLRNLLGPHHSKTGELYGVGPSSFFQRSDVWCHGENPDWQEGYCFADYGIYLER